MSKFSSNSYRVQNQEQSSVKSSESKESVKKPKNFLLDKNLISVLSEKLGEIINTNKSKMKRQVISSPLFKNQKTVKSQMDGLKSKENSKSLKQKLVTQISNEIRANSQKCFDFEKVDEPELQGIIEDFIYIESLRIFRSLKLSMLKRFSSKGILHDYIKTFK